MTPFFTHRPDGLITGSGHCFTEYLAQQGLNGDIAVAGIADPLNQYLQDGEVRTYTEVELQAKNNLPQGWAWQMPERIAVDMRGLDGAKAQAWERIKQSRIVAEGSDFFCNGDAYQSDKERISGAVQMALMAQLYSMPYSIDWTLSDNTVKTLDAAGMIAVGLALGLHINTVFSVGRDLRTQIETATTIAEIDAIGWPA